MTFDEFIQKYNNRLVDWDGSYGAQCYDLAHLYAVECIGKDIPSKPAAKDLWESEIEGYTKIANAKDNFPEKGDIVVWGVELGAWGHVAIAISGDANSFTSFDQNFPLGSPCHVQKHNYTGVLGWFRPNSAIIVQPIAQPNYAPIISEIYQGILGLAPSVDEIKAREDQINNGTVLHDIVSQVLHDDGRSPLKTCKALISSVKTILYGKGWPYQKINKLKVLLPK